MWSRSIETDPLFALYWWAGGGAPLQNLSSRSVHHHSSPRKCHFGVPSPETYVISTKWRQPRKQRYIVAFGGFRGPNYSFYLWSTCRFDVAFSDFMNRKGNGKHSERARATQRVLVMSRGSELKQGAHKKSGPCNNPDGSRDNLLSQDPDTQYQSADCTTK